MDVVVFAEVRNGYRKRKSKRRNRGSLTKMTKYIRHAFVLIVACCTPNIEDDIVIVPQQIDGTDFIYPQDRRYLGNSELLTQLLMLEAKFNQQTEMLSKLKRKGKPHFLFRFYFLCCNESFIHFMLIGSWFQLTPNWITTRV